jgi:DNA-binding NtrC family response regulator
MTQAGCDAAEDRAPSAAAAIGEGSEPAPDPGVAGRTILLVEDDEGSAYAVARCLRAIGYEVVAARDFRQALEALDSPRSIDLLLTDIRLTAGTPHGFALGRMARMRRPQLRVVYITGVADLPESEIEGALGPVLRKPLDPAILAAEIARALADA